MTTVIRLWQIEDRGESIRFATAPPDRDERKVTISRSVIEHISRGPVLPNGWRVCEVRLPDWLIIKEDL